MQLNNKNPSIQNNKKKKYKWKRRNKNEWIYKQEQ